jgi:hypothetical protein
VKFDPAAGNAANKSALQSKRLTRMPADRATSLTLLAAESRQAAAKPWQQSRAFQPDLYQAQILTDHARQLKCLAAALRRTEGEMEASQLAT